jgi:hypothetical protein
MDSNPSEKRYPVRMEAFDLELICAGSSVEEMMQFLALTRRMQDEGRHVIVELADTMASKIVSWSRQEPFSLQALLRGFDFPDLYEILKQYTAVVIGVADPLDRPSSAGAQSAEESDPKTELLLANLSS